MIDGSIDQGPLEIKKKLSQLYSNAFMSGTLDKLHFT